LLDDGFQNPTIAKTLSLVVVDAAYGLGNGRVIPAGPLRESLARGLGRADALVLLGTEAEARRAQWIKIGRGLPVLPAVLAPIAGDRLAGSRLLAFAGIGRPGVRRDQRNSVPRRHPILSDHHPYHHEIEQLLRGAERAEARSSRRQRTLCECRRRDARRSKCSKSKSVGQSGCACGFIKPVVLSALGNGRNRQLQLRYYDPLSTVGRL
jgi:hypothetical protein